MGCVNSPAVIVEKKVARKVEESPESSIERPESPKSEKKTNFTRMVIPRVSPIKKLSTTKLEIISESPRQEYKYTLKKIHKSQKSLIFVGSAEIELKEYNSPSIPVSFYVETIKRTASENILDVLDDINTKYIDIYFLNHVITEKITMFPYILDEKTRIGFVFSLYMMFYLRDSKEVEDIKLKLVSSFLSKALENTPKDSKLIALRRVLNDVTYLFLSVYIAHSYPEKTHELVQNRSFKQLDQLVDYLSENLQKKGEAAVKPGKLLRLLEEQLTEPVGSEKLLRLAEELSEHAEPHFYNKIYE